jgi:hypothetical protein
MKPGMPDFSWRNIPKRGKIYQMILNYTIWPQHRPNGRKIDRMAIKFTNLFHCKTLQNWPKLGFLVWKYSYHLAAVHETHGHRLKNSGVETGWHFRRTISCWRSAPKTCHLQTPWQWFRHQGLSPQVDFLLRSTKWTIRSPRHLISIW